jgi:hypothetical protein
MIKLFSSNIGWCEGAIILLVLSPLGAIGIGRKESMRKGKLIYWQSRNVLLRTSPRLMQSAWTSAEKIVFLSRHQSTSPHFPLWTYPPLAIAVVNSNESENSTQVEARNQSMRAGRFPSTTSQTSGSCLSAISCRFRYHSLGLNWFIALISIKTRSYFWAFKFRWPVCSRCLPRDTELSLAWANCAPRDSFNHSPALTIIETRNF